MYLSKLEIFGFKSFANKTVVNFTKGITGIVGPNGCGKTNIVDAIRWCLGEQKSSTLRSDKMENVIFNGTRSKKPMGMAEVSLTIVNDKGILPTDFSEVTITRRIFRSGESEYLLNKNICRLKDITNLFMDTGMGTNAYSVIELKMIETILSNKADERRKMFEEAAGVNKYKLRRRLSLKKLDDVKKDLTRVNDIVSEVEKTVRSLERQAKKADRYNQIQSELKEKELNLAEREFFLFSSQLAGFETETIELTSKKNEIDYNIKEIENNLIAYRDEISNIEAKYRSKSTSIAELTNKIYNLQKNISVSEERTKALQSNIERFKNNIEEFTYQKDEAEENILEYGSNIEELEQKLSEKISGLQEAKTLLQQKKEELYASKEIYKAKNDEYLEHEKRLNSIENELTNNQKAVEQYNANVNKLNNSIQFLTSEIAKSVGFLEDLENELASAKQKFEQSEKEYSRMQNEKEKIEKEISELKIREADERSKIQNVKEKIEFFQTLLNNLEGLSSGSKSLMESEGWTNNEKAILANIGNSKDEYRFAVEASLKNVLNNILIETEEELKSGIDYLKKNNLGKAGFVLKNKKTKTTFFGKLYNYSLNKQAKKISKANGFVDWLINVIDAEPKWKKYFEKIIGNVAIVKSFKDAITLSKKFPEYSFVSVEGDFIHKDGIVEAGSAAKLDNSLFGRKQLLEDLRTEYPLLEQNLLKLKSVIEEKEKIAESINLKELSDNGRILLNEINNIEKQISQIQFEKEKSAADIEKLQNEIQENITNLNFLESNISVFQNNIVEESEKISGTKTELEEFEKKLSALEEEYTEQQNTFNNLNLEIERLKGEIQNKRNLLAKAKESKNSFIQSIERLHNEIKKSEEEIETIKSVIEETRLEYNDINADKISATEELTKIENELNSKKEEAAEHERELNELRHTRQEISDRIHNAQIKSNEIAIRFENLVNHIKEEYSYELQKKEFDDMDVFDFDSVRSDVHSLKERIKNLGPINLLAYSEYEEEKERLDFLHKQRDDLIESEKDLIKTIKEINESAEKVFLDTFEAIRTNFKKIFQSVFNPGDEADLILEEGVDPLEAKIEIVAKPKGKRPTGIELLSGGEKTLTATALLFAIYLVKPSPFCIMDEVDAPLDDANIDRFTNLLKDFSDNTQFIIVTHNKRTMEAAENMYGVTIQQEGISKLVGVQFNDQLSVSA